MDKILSEILMEIRGIKEKVYSIDERVKNLESMYYENNGIEKSILSSQNEMIPNYNKTDFNLQKIWSQAINMIKDELTEVSFNTWIKNIEPLEKDKNIIYASVQNDFTKEIVKQRYSEMIKTALKAVTAEIYDLKILVEGINKK